MKGFWPGSFWKGEHQWNRDSGKVELYQNTDLLKVFLDTLFLKEKN